MIHSKTAINITILIILFTAFYVILNQISTTQLNRQNFEPDYSIKTEISVLGLTSLLIVLFLSTDALSHWLYYFVRVSTYCDMASVC